MHWPTAGEQTSTFSLLLRFQIRRNCARNERGPPFKGLPVVGALTGEIEAHFWRESLLVLCALRIGRGKPSAFKEVTAQRRVHERNGLFVQWIMTPVVGERQGSFGAQFVILLQGIDILSTMIRETRLNEEIVCFRIHIWTPLHCIAFLITVKQYILLELALKAMLLTIPSFFLSNYRPGTANI